VLISKSRYRKSRNSGPGINYLKVGANQSFNFCIMKKLLSCFLLFLFFSFSNAQCIITGTDTPVVQFSSSYSVPVGSAQCSSCYYWSVSGAAAINGDNTGNSVSITFNQLGAVTISVTYFTGGQLVSCSKNITVVYNNGCNFLVSVSSSYLASGSTNPAVVTLQGTVNPTSVTGVTYVWSAKYQNGAVGAPSSVNGLQATFVATQANPIVSATLTGNGPMCSSTYTRLFPQPIYGNPGLGGGGITIGKTAADGTISGERFLLAPNPVKNELLFSGDADNLSDYKVSVYDLSGREVVSNAPVGSKIPFGNHVSGVYQFVITGPDNYRQEGKIVKE
jgi:hypothetical protein